MSPLRCLRPSLELQALHLISIPLQSTPSPSQSQQTSTAQSFPSLTTSTLSTETTTETSVPSSGILTVPSSLSTGSTASGTSQVSTSHISSPSSHVTSQVSEAIPGTTSAPSHITSSQTTTPEPPSTSTTSRSRPQETSTSQNVPSSTLSTFSPERSTEFSTPSSGTSTVTSYLNTKSSGTSHEFPSSISSTNSHSTSSVSESSTINLPTSSAAFSSRLTSNDHHLSSTSASSISEEFSSVQTPSSYSRSVSSSAVTSGTGGINVTSTPHPSNRTVVPVTAVSESSTSSLFSTNNHFSSNVSPSTSHRPPAQSTASSSERTSHESSVASSPAVFTTASTTESPAVPSTSTLTSPTALPAPGTPLHCFHGVVEGDLCKCWSPYTGRYCERVMSEVTLVNITATVKISVRVINWKFEAGMEIRGSYVFNVSVGIFEKQMEMVYSSIPGYQSLKVLRFSNGSVNVAHDVTLQLPFSGFNATYGASVQDIHQKLRETAWSSTDSNLSRECQQRAVQQPSLQPYYVARNVSNRLQCVSNCSSWHPDPFACMHGKCYIGSGGPACYCQQSDAYWFSGQRCEQQVSKVGVAVGVAVGLAVLLLTLLLLATLLCWQRCRWKEGDPRPTGLPPDEEKWYENDAEWGAQSRGRAARSPAADSLPEPQTGTSSGRGSAPSDQGTFRPRLDKVDTSLQAWIARPRMTQL
ncbi:hypothetical protein lerEdw1_006361 [Lerista edwardsae]|nr:hypothetical protein lerEdw1_006361 [Lerista edwardsae]